MYSFIGSRATDFIALEQIFMQIHPRSCLRAGSHTPGASIGIGVLPVSISRGLGQQSANAVATSCGSSIHNPARAALEWMVRTPHPLSVWSLLECLI